MRCVMKNIETIIEESRVKLKKVLKQLEILEKEKAVIINRYENAGPAQKILIKVEMEKSAENFKKLSEQAFILAEKVKKLKKQCI